ncbi:peptidase S11 D-alanyl-D-alanine carboxypeptidase 1 [Coriobacterium glomerans PW2]|uniref:Peptidase S11 D-alanyl-D-alanine carboxypeptidase 1 n=1 Tax=Coriobacterium glomerans (strain ATCC 49209 / DSM 20642 / JCM 10262 / PW2) TaxID=700015 RepID=F2NAF9_CORGP|nr:D-alanyl-D-alanine carboxypeptidase [Coriobacterium glomerans]AEB06486.1 peptidase S11 D-alanyl-D-alanine carboxypeptidase 1 [Coriobacterium glomerans PW2]
MNTSTRARLRSRLQRHASRLLIVICAVLALIVCMPARAHAETRADDLVCGESIAQRGLKQRNRPDIQAGHAIVMGRDGICYFERDADAQVKIASITKVMTALVALSHGKKSETIAVDRAAATVGEASAHLREGDALSLEDALRCLLIPSGNDAALAIATAIGSEIDPTSSDPDGVFVNAMNEKAKQLGCTGTNFTNPHGLDMDPWAGDMHSTARDVAIMVAAAMRDDTFRSIVGTGAARVTVRSADGASRTLELSDVNQMLNAQGNIGVKTGTTDEAGYCFAGAFSRDGNEVYTVVLGANTSQQRFDDSASLATWYYAHAKRKPAVSTDRTGAGGEALIARATCTDWSDRTVDVTTKDGIPDVTVFDLADPMKQHVELKEFKGTVHRGEDAGTLTLTEGGKTMATIKLVTAQESTGPNPVEWALVQLDRFTRMLEGKPSAAESSVFAVAPGS